MTIVYNLQKVISSFWEATGYFLYWGGLVFGDMYGNRGVNLNGYYLWSAVLYVVP